VPWFIQPQARFVIPQEQTCYRHGTAGRNIRNMIREVNDEPDYRFTLANERTFLAWQRTALGLLAATVALLQFVPGPAVQGMQYILSTGLGILAIVSAGAGLLRWRRVDRAIRCTERLPRNRTPTLLASGLMVLGLVVSVSVVVKAVNG
jgi:putative membrane protein